ncbi:MAG: DegT/DnrJ/EryC1/StrS family aminotransferase [Planctomycetota bacterium]|jgi:dTDP-4-amino-4,6-dideoxygalactose transaminase|nr:DegT/DnrJ/EryC1/StrS family aminotransferase [Planctomycetota bacterium]
MSKLAINGGPKVVPDDIGFRTWPEITKEDEESVLASLRQDKHASGPHVQLLQSEFSEWNGTKHVMATNGGTSALHLCVAGCGIGPGDEVITTALSWTSSATAIIHHNAIPVFADVDWDHMMIDPKSVEAAITPSTRGILVVHYFGIACDMDAIQDVADRHNLKVIEDACQAHGSTWKGTKVGNFGDAAAFSLNQNKNLCGGEGGFFVTSNDEVLQRGKAVTSFSDMRPPEAGRDFHDYGLGWMYRTSDLAASFALSQLRKLDKTNEHARANWYRLSETLKGTPRLVPSFSSDDQPTNGYAYVVRTEPAYAKERGVKLSDLTNAVAKALGAEGLTMSRANWMLPAHSVFQAKNAYGKGSPWTDGHCKREVNYDVAQFPVAQDCVDTCLWNVNTHRPPNGDRQVDAFAAAVRKVYENLDEVPVEAG